MLDTCSVGEHRENRSYGLTADMIDLINHRLCPGQWCTRMHCSNSSRYYAYNCNKTRPSVCKIYKEYVRKKELKEKTKE